MKKKLIIDTSTTWKAVVNLSMPRLGEEEPQLRSETCDQTCIAWGLVFGYNVCNLHHKKLWPWGRWSPRTASWWRNPPRSRDRSHTPGCSIFVFQSNKCIMEDAYFDTFVFMLSNQNKGQKNGPWKSFMESMGIITMCSADNCQFYKNRGKFTL